MSKATETILEIDLQALRHNYRYLTSRLNKETKVMAVVKASGYGSEPLAVAKELAGLGVDYFAVAYVSEGIALRDEGIETPILVLHPQIDNFEAIISRCLEPALYSRRILTAFIESAERLGQNNYPVHLKFNSGLNRLGVVETDLNWIVDRLNETTSIRVKSLFSHLVASEDASERTFSLQQIQRFKSFADDFQRSLSYMPLLHQSNTSGIINFPEAHFDMVRTGIGLYGYANHPDEDRQLKPVALLKSVISQIHTIQPNETVGYNRAYTAKATEKSATIPIGHADGIPRSLGNGTGHVLINGEKAPIIGNVCMDMLMVNVSEIECEEGDEVIIIGEDIPATVLSEAANTISYELLTGVSQRIRRVIKNASE